MIDIVTENTPNLKNIRQIGNPTETDKIYIEASAYERIHLEEFPEKRVFVFMGHTECKERSYSTFIEAAIAVREITFDKNTPIWTNHVWNDVFREIKQSYENSVIVGWAVDIKGMSPKITEELESVHREQFGGVHQLILLMDSLEQEEFFYQSRNNHLRQKDGFYIYYDPAAMQPPAEEPIEFPKHETWKKHHREDADIEETRQAQEQETEDVKPRKARYRELLKEEPQHAISRGTAGSKPQQGRYRDILNGEKQPDPGKRLSAYAMAAAILLLVGIIGTGIYQNRISLPNFNHVLETITSHAGVSNDEQADGEQTDGEQQEDSLTEADSEQILLETAKEDGTSDDSEIMDTATIPVEEVPGGTVVGSEITDTQQTDDSVETGVEELSGLQTDVDVEAAPTYYTVKKGDTLLQICRSVYGSTDRLAEIEALNGLTDPDAIYEGQQLILPQ